METHLHQVATIDVTTVFNLSSLFELESALDHIKKKVGGSEGSHVCVSECVRSEPCPYNSSFMRERE